MPKHVDVYCESPGTAEACAKMVKIFAVEKPPVSLCAWLRSCGFNAADHVDHLCVKGRLSNVTC